MLSASCRRKPSRSATIQAQAVMTGARLTMQTFCASPCNRERASARGPFKRAVERTSSASISSNAKSSSTVTSLGALVGSGRSRSLSLERFLGACSPNSPPYPSSARAVRRFRAGRREELEQRGEGQRGRVRGDLARAFARRASRRHRARVRGERSEVNLERGGEDEVNVDIRKIDGAAVRERCRVSIRVSLTIGSAHDARRTRRAANVLRLWAKKPAPR